MSFEQINAYPITAMYLKKRGETRCQRCLQILKNRGTEGYQRSIEKGTHKVIIKGSDNYFRGMKK